MTAVHRAPSRLSALTTATTLAAFSVAASGCYNTYQVPQDDFRRLQSVTAINEDGKLQDRYKDTPEELTKLQSRGENDAVVVASVKNEKVGVGRDTRIYVRTDGGRRYQLTPFNFSMSSSQLVASDRDTLLPLANLKAYEVDLLSTGKTASVIAAGVLGAGAFIAVIIATSGSKSF